MPRMKSVTSIEAKIALAQEKLLAAEARYNAWAEKLLALQKEKEEVQAANRGCKVFCVQAIIALP